MNATKSNAAKYEQYLNNPLRQIKKTVKSDPLGVKSFNIRYSSANKSNSFSSVQSLVSIFYFQDGFRVVLGSFGDHLESRDHQGNWDHIGRRTGPKNRILIWNLFWDCRSVAVAPLPGPLLDDMSKEHEKLYGVQFSSVAYVYIG